MRNGICGRLILIVSLFLALCCNSLPYDGVFADDSLPEEVKQNDAKLELSPVSKRMSFKPGEQKKDSLQLRNSGPKDISVNLYASNYYIDDGSTDQTIKLADHYTQMSQWVTFLDSDGEYRHKITVQVPSNQSKTINYAVDVPSEATGGGQYAILFAEFAPVESTGGGIQARYRMGMTLFAFVDDAGIIRGAELGSIKAPIGLLLDRKIDIDYTVKNTGNIDFQTSADIAVFSIFGNEIYHDINVETIFPETSKDIHVEWKETPAFGILRLNYAIKALDKKEEGSYVIFVISTGIVCLIVVVLTILTIVIIYRRRKKQWSKRRAEALGNK
ncbi:hypothetical protein IKG06_03970 [Candidatus Saccharibacteria bacterium]|nr:hypothetical protein [Candidatus Saccharibacteria bacterium]